MTYSAEVLADSPLAYWRRGEGDVSTSVDSSGNGRDATYASASGDAAGLLVGDSDRAHAMRSTIADAAWMDVDQITIECWIKINTLTANQGIVSRFSNVGGSAWLLWVNVTGSGQIAVRFYNDIATQVDLAWSTTPSTGTVYHVAASYESGSAKLYINGSVVASSTSLTGPLRSGTAAIDASTYDSSGSFAFSGVNDEVAIYDHVLTPTRVLAHYNAGIGAQTVTGGLAAETDAALAGTTVPGAVTIAGGLSTETDAALAGAVVSGGQVVSGGLPTEADSALAGTTVPGAVTIAGGLSTETDAALTGAVLGSLTITGGLATETDSALAGSVGSGLLGGLAEEANSALAGSVVAGAVTIAGGLANETNTALSGVVFTVQTVVGGLALEADEALGGLVAGAPQTIGGGLTLETDSALTGSVFIIYPNETDTANRGNGRHRSGYATLVVTYPLAATPATKEPIRVMAQSVPTQTMSGGQPV